MTNLEHYKYEISNRWMGYVKQRGQERYSEYLGLAIIDVFKEDLKMLGFDDPVTSVSEVMHWLTREYQKPIKLKQWEKDFLELADYKGYCFCAFGDYGAMKNRGYFEGVTDTDMTIEEILENCEVVE